MRKTVSFLTMLMLWSVLAFSQTRTITGRVTDDSNQPVAGASVTIKGTSTGTVADANGNFSINAKTGDVLVISAVGIPTKEMTVGPGSSITVSMTRQAQNMSEVVVTALGIRRGRNQVAYSAQQVSGEEVSKNRGGNFISNLSGKVSGIEIRQNNVMGGSTNVVLRGAKSLTGSNQALFVVDGVPIDNTNNNTTDQVIGRGGYDYGNAAADINPDNIESITVLKGPNASALYGSRGFNGVVLITTKKGRKGFNVTANFGISKSMIDKSTFPTYQKTYGQGYGKYYSNSTNPYFEGADLDGDGKEDLITPTTEDASYGQAFDPKLMVYQWQSHDKTSAFYKKKQPWVAAANDPSTFFIKPISTNANVLIEAGNDKGTYALGYTRINEKGVLPNSSLDKDLFNVAATYKITDKITASASGNFSKIRGFGRYGTGYDGANALNVMTNFRQWWNVGVDMKDLEAAYWRNQKNVTWNWADPKSFDFTAPAYWDNPYFVRFQNYENDTRNRLLGSMSLTWQANKWLNLLGRVTYDGYDEIEEERKAYGSVGVPFYRRFNQSYNEQNYDLIATGNWDLSNDVNLKALLGSTTRLQKRSNIDASTNGGLGIPGLYALSNSKEGLLPAQEYEATKRVESGYASATATFKNTYTLDATFRRDATSTLSKDRNKYNYYSASGGVVLSQLIKQSWLSYSKLRLSYAEVGSDAAPYVTTNTYNYDLDPNSGSQVTAYNGQNLFSSPNTNNNKDLKPERTKSIELGLEASFLKSRVGFDITYYNAKTEDQIIPLTVSAATGYSRSFLNSGVIRNKGIELSLYGTPVKTRNLSWDISVNWTRNRNKVEELFDSVDNIVLGSFQGSLTVNASLGEAYGTIHGSDFTYINGQRVVAAATGRYVKTSTNNRTIGNVNPDWIGGINNKITYKGVSLSFLIDIRQGGDVFSTDLYYGLATGLYPETAGKNDLGNPIRNTIADGGGILRDGVNEDGKPNTKRAEAYNYGAYGYRYAPDKMFVYDASYVKLREAAIGYSLPSKIYSRTFIKGIELSFIGRNLWIIHKNLPYADPEDSFGSGNLQGIQTGSYPTTRSYGFNIKLKL